LISVKIDHLIKVTWRIIFMLFNKSFMDFYNCFNWFITISFYFINYYNNLFIFKKI